jgi:hypothetical protein
VPVDALADGKVRCWGSNSMTAMRSPRADRNASPMGATGIGRHGTKKRSSLNGHSNAQPRPPLVIVSWQQTLAATLARGGGQFLQDCKFLFKACR